MKIFLLLIPITLYSLSWIFMKKYQRLAGGGTFSLAIYNFAGIILSFSVLLIMRGFTLHSNIYTMICAAVYGVGLMVYNGFKVKISELGPLSIMSMFTTLGAVVLTMLYGFIFLDEKVTFFKIIAAILVAASFVPLIVKNKKAGKKSSFVFLLLCTVVFIMNGALTIVSKVAQVHSEDPGDMVDWVALYLFYGLLTSAVITLPALSKSTSVERDHVFSVKTIIVTILAFVCSTSATVVNLYFASMFDASVQFPLVNTGIMVMTTVVASIMYSEKPDKSTILSLILAILAVVTVSLPF